jgi:hypothetical protein
MVGFMNRFVGLSSNLPKSSSIKVIDVWMLFRYDRFTVYPASR